VFCGAHRLSVCTTQHMIKTEEVHKYTKTTGWLDSHTGSIPHNRSQTKQDISSIWLCQEEWLSLLLCENCGCSDSVITTTVLRYLQLRGSKTFSYSPVFTVFTQVQDNTFSLNLLLTHVRSPYIMYEALNRTMQSQTSACSTKCQQKAEHSMAEVTTSLSFFLSFLFFHYTII